MAHSKAMARSALRSCVQVWVITSGYGDYKPGDKVTFQRIPPPNHWALRYLNGRK